MCSGQRGQKTNDIYFFVTEQQADHGEAAEGADKQLPQRTQGPHLRRHEKRRELRNIKTLNGPTNFIKKRKNTFS